MSKTTYEITNPFTSQIETKTSSRDYTHAVVAKFKGEWWEDYHADKAHAPSTGTITQWTGVKDPLKKAQRLRKDILRGDFGEATEVQVKVVEIGAEPDADEAPVKIEHSYSASFCETQAKSFRVLANIKEGKIDGVDTQPEMTAEDCYDQMNTWFVMAADARN